MGKQKDLFGKDALTGYLSSKVQRAEHKKIKWGD